MSAKLQAAQILEEATYLAKHPEKINELLKKVKRQHELQYYTPCCTGPVTSSVCAECCEYYSNQ